MDMASCVSVLLLAATLVAGQSQSPFSIESADAIKSSASTLAWDMLQYYKGNQSGATPGILPGPPPAGDYYWWEAGAMWGTLMDYWAWTGDSTYNHLVASSMLFQSGDHHDYQPPNVTLSLGNDDQAFWGMSAMLAAELKFPDPPPDKPQWLALAQAVFNTQAHPDRHDDYCGGGLHWQIPSTNRGYNYKNSIANGCFFNIAARLYRFTGDESYAAWATRTWDWMEHVGFLNKETYAIYDGAHVETQCTDLNRAEFSYNNGVFAQGAAFMYNATEDPIWKARTEKLVDFGLKKFFPEGIAVEVACETVGTCTTDMITFKGFMHRWYSVITQIVPSTYDSVAPVLKSSAAAAIKQCNAGALGRQCGFRWATGAYDGRTGAGQEMNVLAAVSSQLIFMGGGDVSPPAPVTAKTGGTSKGDPNAGSGGDETPDPLRPISTPDRAGAGTLTVIAIIFTCGLSGWMCLGA
ncbi:hypothetical protein L249_2242 [Ophiocordyceps polyrhachis-furcata BCC 54312]|uniref:Mannan endo-1,6-alpha-mannosidase n=1 Tax=Ophiocordyceps polyrhachis-furcata BCC 54312 TaxID=1330021 RepID=A0A367LS32_9HYPO|nr:hypothetical protein L249_2242 [Ophiocordyceps polyrhachis-furcata BCC 54312]